MSSTNKTTNYNLSQFVGTDVPSYLGDYNSDMSKIDKAIGDVANSHGSLEQSVVGLTAEVQGLSTQVDGDSTRIQQLQTTVAQIDSGYKQADTTLSQRITTNANNIQTNTTAIESINTTIGTENISGIGDGTIKGAISNINSSLTTETVTIAEGLNLNKSGNICVLVFNNYNLTAPNTVIITEKYRPSTTVRCFVRINTDNKYYPCVLVITPDGAINGSFISETSAAVAITSGTLYGEAVWII